MSPSFRFIVSVEGVIAVACHVCNMFGLNWKFMDYMSSLECESGDKVRIEGWTKEDLQGKKGWI